MFDESDIHWALSIFLLIAATIATLVLIFLFFKAVGWIGFGIITLLIAWNVEMTTAPEYYNRNKDNL